jgi:hypothetical protein
MTLVVPGGSADAGSAHALCSVLASRNSSSLASRSRLASPWLGVLVLIGALLVSSAALLMWRGEQGLVGESLQLSAPSTWHVHAHVLSSAGAAAWSGRWASRIRSAPRGTPEHPCVFACGEEQCAHATPLRCSWSSRARAPSYVTAGYSQAGSTFFEAVLTAHPGVSRACAKEVHFFDQALPRLGVEQEPDFGSYLRCFSGGAFSGDNTVKNMYCDAAIPMWLRALNPELRVVVLLREPVQRALSRYMQKGGGRGCESRVRPASACLAGRNFTHYALETMRWVRANCPGVAEGVAGAEQAYRCGASGWRGRLKTDADTLVSSLYGPHLEHWLRFFPRSRFTLVASDALFSAPNETMSRVAAELGLDPFDFAPAAARAARASRNSHGSSRAAASLAPDVLAQLRAFFRPSNDKLLTLAGAGEGGVIGGVDAALAAWAGPGAGATV